MDEARDLPLPRLLEEHMGSQDVRLREDERVLYRIVHVALGGEVDDGVRSFYCAGHRLRVANVPLHELVAWLFLKPRKILQIAAICQFI